MGFVGHYRTIGALFARTAPGPLDPSTVDDTLERWKLA